MTDPAAAVMLSVPTEESTQLEHSGTLDARAEPKVPMGPAVSRLMQVQCLPVRAAGTQGRA